MNRLFKPSVQETGGKSLVPIKMSEELKKYAHDYARRNETTVSQLVRDYFVYVREREEANAKGQAY